MLDFWASVIVLRNTQCISKVVDTCGYQMLANQEGTHEQINLWWTCGEYIPTAAYHGDIPEQHQRPAWFVR